MQLQRCMRLLPHHQDSGGFFVALLRKREGIAVSKCNRCAGLYLAQRQVAPELGLDLS